MGQNHNSYLFRYRKFLSVFSIPILKFNKVYPIKKYAYLCHIDNWECEKEEECTQDLCRIDGHYFSAEVYYMLEQKYT